MFCSQCGKKVMDSMFFCPFCGSPIVIPDQETEIVTDKKAVKPAPVSVPVEVEQPAPAPEAPAAADAGQGGSETLNISINWGSDDFIPEQDEGDEDEYEDLSEEFAEDEDDEEEDDAFVPLDLDAFEEDEIESLPDRDVSGEISELLSSQLKEEPVQLGGHVPDLSNISNPDRGRPRRAGKNTYAPVKAFDPNDIFLDAEDEDEDYEDYEEDDYDYEEPERGGFFVRHIRGIVALSLCVIVLAIVAGWACSDNGQMALANANLAWRPSVYERIGYEAYQKGNYVLSAGYYEKALARENDNYSYAYSAGIAYYMAEDIVRAAEMGKTAIEINPARSDAYQLLLRLYPDASTRPWDVSSLLRKGYQLTGDASLNVES